MSIRIVALISLKLSKHPRWKKKRRAIGPFRDTTFIYPPTYAFNFGKSYNFSKF